jgi:hypothetical protein
MVRIPRLRSALYLTHAHPDITKSPSGNRNIQNSFTEKLGFALS